MMTQIIPYENLTWPEIASIPRETPMIIPLGTGYSMAELSELLDHPHQIGVLPPIPYGWPESGLKIDIQPFQALLTNLINSLKEDGFSRVLALVPGAQVFQIEIDHILLPPSARALTTSAMPPDSDREKVVIIPIGHTEQHAFHLPLCTDTLIIDAIGAGIVNKTSSQATLLPTMPYGASTHRSSFIGTLNSGGRAFEDYYLGVIDQLVMCGFDRFYLISGHGGNVSHLVNIVKYAGERHKNVFCATSWLYLSGPQGIDAINTHRKSGLGGMGHACELETSIVLYLRPDLVHMERVVDELDFINTPSYYMDWVEGGALIANPSWEDDTITGAYGAGSLATAENGKIWLETAIEEKVMHVAEIHEQHLRRKARRTAGYGLWGKTRKF